MRRAPPQPVPSVRPSLGCASRQQSHRHGHLVVLVHTLPLIEHRFCLVSVQLWARTESGRWATSQQDRGGGAGQGWEGAQALRISSPAQ